MSHHPHLISTADEPTKVILVLTTPPSERDTEQEREEEMRRLLETANCVVCDVARQHLSKPVTATYIGSGKIEEVRQLAEQHDVDEVCFDTQLTPSQERNIEKHLERRVVDYTALILHIFAGGAKTKQARLAVELAQLEHNRSRLKRLWSHLDRLKAGTNMRGPGEKQLEVDRRLVDQRIQDLKARLTEIEARKERAIASRDDCFKVALVGYTNAGKSSLMNALTNADVLAQDKLFATLDTRTTRLHIDHPRQVVISDTVGFIRKLPHSLVASFHATLAEVIEADLLLHVVDASLPSMEDQVAAVEDVLEQIGAKDVPTIMVWNKIDRPHSRTIVLAFRRRYKGSIAISAHTEEGLDDLREAIRGHLAARSRRIEVAIPIADGATAAFLRRQTAILDERYDATHAVFTIEADQDLLANLSDNPAVTVSDAAPAEQDSES